VHTQARNALLVEGVPLQRQAALSRLGVPHPQAAVVVTTHGYDMLAVWGEGTCCHWTAVAGEHLQGLYGR
jgi:hypothetical protein